MEPIKTHWKKLTHPDYIGAYELMQGDNNIELNVKIQTVKREMITGADGKKEECTIMSIPPHKPMILNATNQKNLTKAIGSPFIEDWAGKVVTLYVQKVKAFGDTVDALRIKDKVPAAALPVFNESAKNWIPSINAIKNGTNDIESAIAGIKTKYELSAENELKFREACNETV